MSINLYNLYETGDVYPLLLMSTMFPFGTNILRIFSVA